MTMSKKYTRIRRRRQTPWLSSLILLLHISFGCSFFAPFNNNQQAACRRRRTTSIVHRQSLSDDDEREPERSSITRTPQERILEWASSLPEPTFVSHLIGVKVRPPEEGGAGLFATAHIAFNETLAVLPFDMRRSSSGSSNEHNNNHNFPGFKFDAPTVIGLLNDGPAKERLSELLDEAVGTNNKRRMASILAGAIAHLHLTKLRRSSQQMDSSREESNENGDPIDLFLDVLPMLPTDNVDAGHPFPSHVLFWTDDQIEKLLAGTLALTKARFMRAQAGELVGLLSTAFIQEHCPTMSLNEIAAAKDAIVSAFACVASRTFEGLNATDTAESGSLMIPFVDLLNHMPADGRNVRHAVDDDRNAAILVSDREIEAGEEISINYGERQAWDWGTKYGFVPADDDEEESNETTVALPIFPQTVRNGDGIEVNMTTKGEEGLQALNAIRIAVEAVDDQSASDDDLMLAELFLPEVEYSSSPFPAKHGCVIVHGTPESAKEIATPLFECADYIARTIQQGRTIDQDTACSLMLGLSGDEEASSETNGVDQYMLHRARERCDMLETGKREAEAWANREIRKQEYTAIRLQLANQMREAELISARQILEYLF